MAKGLPLVCRNHNNEVWCTEPDDFTRYAGGCNVDCKGQLTCGHACQLKCHPMDHKNLPCVMPCALTLNCGHKCGRRCSEICSCDCPNFRRQVWTGDRGNTSLASPGNTSSTAHPSQQGSTGFSNQHRGSLTVARDGGTQQNAHQHQNALRGDSSHSQIWQNFTRNVVQHDENAYQSQLAARESATAHNAVGFSSEINHHPIREQWRQTTMRNGRRGSAIQEQPLNRRQPQPMDLIYTEASPRPEPNKQQANSGTPGFPVNTVSEAHSGYGFEAEVVGVVSRGVSGARSSSSRNAMPVKKNDSSQDEWLIEL